MRSPGGEYGVEPSGRDGEDAIGMRLGRGRVNSSGWRPCQTEMMSWMRFFFGSVLSAHLLNKPA